jgi:anaerobic nitric oxide reductase transcription regulator
VHLGHLQSSVGLQSSQGINPLRTQEPSAQTSSNPVIHNLKEATEAFQKQSILTVLIQCNYNWSQAARSLEMDRANLVRLAKRLGIEVSKQIK